MGGAWRRRIATLALLACAGFWPEAAGAQEQSPSVPATQTEQSAPTTTSPATPTLTDLVRKEARELSFAPFKPVDEITTPLADDYDQYRRLRFQPSRALWHRNPPGFELHGLPLGWLFKRPIELYAVEGGNARQVQFTGADFLDEREVSANQRLGLVPVPLSGFRIGGPLNGLDKVDEIIVFQGASYFRALGRGHVYGLSARGLAIGTASNKGEEFPTFRKFWVEKPDDRAKHIVIHALLDSPSTTGAYTFNVHPGAETIVDVDAVLYPRNAMSEAGIAPLTSMFLVGPVDPVRVRDFRPRVHDSDGLAIMTGNGERVWRPLSNPRKLQVSAFVDNNPRGFGLSQRARNFAGYQDLEARYERRPSLWVEFADNVGAGSVFLVELPTEEEIHDNIVAFWRPSERLEKGREQPLRYRLRWRNEAPTQYVGPWVSDTRIGRAYHGAPQGSLLFVVEYRDGEPFNDLKAPVAKASASEGAISNLVTQRNPETGGIRVSFVFDPKGKDLAELRLTLDDWNGRVPETWLYRWTSGK